MSIGPSYHAWTHRPEFIGGSDALQPYGFYEIKVFADRGALDGNLPDAAIVVSTGDGKFIFAIPKDLDGSSLVHAACFVSVTGAIVVQISNLTQAYDFLSTPMSITFGDFTSYTSSTLAVIDDPHPVVAVSDLISIDVDEADGSAEGLGVILSFAII